MLKIKDNVDLKKLEAFGFKKEPEKSYYYKQLCSGAWIEIQIFQNDKLFKPRYININTACASLFFEIDTIYDLINAGLIEKVEKNDKI